MRGDIQLFYLKTQIVHIVAVDSPLNCLYVCNRLPIPIYNGLGNIGLKRRFSIYWYYS